MWKELFGFNVFPTTTFCNAGKNILLSYAYILLFYVYLRSPVLFFFLSVLLMLHKRCLLDLWMPQMTYVCLSYIPFMMDNASQLMTSQSLLLKVPELRFYTHKLDVDIMFSL